MTGVLGRGTAGDLRAGLLLLVVVGVAGTALALAYERHWQSPWQLVPWATLGILGAAGVALAVRETAATVWLARAAAALAIAASALGVWQHVDANVTADGAASHHADGQAAPAADDRGPGDDAPAASDHHHGSDRGTASADHHGSDDGGTAATNADAGDAQETASTSASLMDAMTGSAGHAPVPAAMTTIPVGLALALATIGLGGAGVPRERTPREGMPL